MKNRKIVVSAHLQDPSEDDVKDCFDDFSLTERTSTKQNFQNQMRSRKNLTSIQVIQQSSIKSIKLKKSQKKIKSKKGTMDFIPEKVQSMNNSGDRFMKKKRNSIEAIIEAIQPTKSQSQVLKEPEEHSMSQQKNEKIENSLKTSRVNSLSKNIFSKKKKKKKQLKEIVESQRISNIVHQFISKLKRNNIYSKIVDFDPFQMESQFSLKNIKGFQVHHIIDKIMAFLSVIQIVMLTFLYSISLLYTEINQSPLLQNLQNISLAFYLVEFISNFITVKSGNGKKLQNIGDISLFYLKTSFLIDFLSILILSIDLTSNYPEIDYIRLIVIAKLPQCLQKIQKLQIYFIDNFYNQQYWSLMKVFIFNFCFAHIIAILLGAMAEINSSDNWMVTRGIINSPWYERYIWSYYWATTIMLTVGFGDIVPVTYQEALCVIFIETVSCVALAYNINCVGSLISNIRSQDLEKSKNYKTFKKLSEKNMISEELSSRINNFIEESTNIKKKFNIEEENKFVETLPIGFKKEFLKESNKSMFKSLIFFSTLVEKTLHSLAQKIQMHIAHPEEVLQSLDDHSSLIILKNGQIGYTIKKPNCNFNERILDQVKVLQNQNPYLVNLNFITKKRSNFEVKSLVYSIIYSLDFEKLMNILRESDMDFEMYSYLRDKNKNILNEFEIFPCEFCPQKHTKFECPKLHFIPITQHVIFKNLHKEKTGKNVRKSDPRVMNEKFKSLINFKTLTKGSTALNENTQLNRLNTLKNNGKFLLAGLKQLNDTNEITKGKSKSEDMYKLLFLNATEAIREEFNRKVKEENNEDEIWLLKCDKMKNFTGYFPQNNPCILSDTVRKSKQARRKSRISENKKEAEVYSEFDDSSDEETHHFEFDTLNNIGEDEVKQDINESDEQGDQDEQQ